MKQGCLISKGQPLLFVKKANNSRESCDFCYEIFIANKASKHVVHRLSIMKEIITGVV
jgi:hypothetical protein